ncbi:hypothetical protein N7490_006350 [Penicillium lividum]|nr:hypothetical protein N7490_006350 [Penicillium lividum]
MSNSTAKNTLFIFNSQQHGAVHDGVKENKVPQFIDKEDVGPFAVMILFSRPRYRPTASHVIAFGRVFSLQEARS